MRRFSYFFILPEDNKEDSNFEEALPSIEVGDKPMLRADFEELKADVLQTAKISLEDDLGEMNKAFDDLKSELKLIFISDNRKKKGQPQITIYLFSCMVLKNCFFYYLLFFFQSGYRWRFGGNKDTNGCIDSKTGCVP